MGELGWELYIPAGDAVFVWDRLWQAGKKHRVKAFGYKAVDALRLEKGYLTLYGGEAVLSDGKVISRLRSAGYGHTIKKNIGFVYLPVDMADGKPRLEVEIFGETVTAEVAADILYDPEGNASRK